MATERQRKAAELILVQGKKKGQAMLEAGYSPYTAKTPQKLTDTPFFKGLLEQIKDKAILETIQNIAFDTNDKRASLQACDMLLKLKDRYPAGKLKVEAYQDELSNLAE
jgi:phage terminase small subunit